MDEQILASFLDEIDRLDKLAMSNADIKEKLNAPPTGDTGPPGKGKDDPRFKANVARGFKPRGLTKKASDFIEMLKSRS